MLKVSSILIGVADLHTSRAFYEQLLGMTFEEFRPPFASATLDGVEFNLEENAPGRPSNWVQMYVGGRKQVSFKTDDLESFLKLVVSYGGRIVKGIEEKPWGWKEAVIADMDDNEFIIEQEV